MSLRPVLYRPAGFKRPDCQRLRVMKARIASPVLSSLFSPFSILLSQYSLRDALFPKGQALVIASLKDFGVKFRNVGDQRQQDMGNAVAIDSEPRSSTLYSFATE